MLSRFPGMIRRLGKAASKNEVTAKEIADNAVTLAKMIAQLQGELITYDSGDDPVVLVPGTVGRGLVSGGVGGDLIYQGNLSVASALTEVINVTDSETTIASVTFDTTGRPGTTRVLAIGWINNPGGNGGTATINLKRDSTILNGVSKPFGTNATYLLFDVETAVAAGSYTYAMTVNVTTPTVADPRASVAVIDLGAS